MSNTGSGAWTTGTIASNKLYFVPSSGTLSATVFTSLSDYDAKEQIEKINNAMEILQKIEGVSFVWKHTQTKSYGVIAQQVETVIPDVVESIGGNKTVNYDAIIGFLIEAIKELKADFEDYRLKHP
jgi:hypothetical protein